MWEDLPSQRLNEISGGHDATLLVIIYAYESGKHWVSIM
jgi:hypothetical protein